LLFAWFLPLLLTNAILPFRVAIAKPVLNVAFAQLSPLEALSTSAATSPAK